jgi:hypothetical protein
VNGLSAAAWAASGIDPSRPLSQVCKACSR